MAGKPPPRAERLRSALRENLRRRKEQARDRAQARPVQISKEDKGRNSARIADDEEPER